MLLQPEIGEDFCYYSLRVGRIFAITIFECYCHEDT